MFVLFESVQLVIETGGGVEMRGREKRGWNRKIANDTTTCGNKMLNSK